MAHIILLTDFSERYARDLLAGIMQYSQKKDPWSITRIPLSVRDQSGIEAVLSWAIKTHANAVIGQFYNDDPVEIFAANNILAIAQDFHNRFDTIPNITGDHYETGVMGSKYFIKKGFKNFAFYGIKNIVWSDERCRGFFDEARDAMSNPFCSEYQNDTFDTSWHYNQLELIAWLRLLPKPIAIMAADDNLAYHIAEACQQINESEECRIPYDIAILGVDNDSMICSLPLQKLSSIEQSVIQGGYDAAKMIDQFISDPHAPLNDIIVKPSHIITRDSTDIYANSNKYIAKVVKFIHEKIAERPSVDDIVEQVPMSRRLLEVKFKEEMGVSIYDYIINERIERMTELLRSSMTINEIAIELGFFDTKNISRTFKNIKGITPSQYREELAKKDKEEMAPDKEP